MIAILSAIMTMLSMMTSMVTVVDMFACSYIVCECDSGITNHILQVSRYGRIQALG